MKKQRYKGQSISAHGYGGIEDVTSYLVSKYATEIVSQQEKMLELMNFKINDLDKTKNICSIVAITRILKYYHDQGYILIDKNVVDIYQKVKVRAERSGFKEKRGTNPIKINNITKSVLLDYGYISKARGKYFWDFNTVKKEIDNDRPIIMNIARGYYKNHSITVNGYRVIKTKDKTHIFIAIYDGWSNQQRYLDYDWFSADLLHYGIGSFNTLIIKTNKV